LNLRIPALHALYSQLSKTFNASIPILNAENQLPSKQSQTKPIIEAQFHVLDVPIFQKKSLFSSPPNVTDSPFFRTSLPSSPNAKTARHFQTKNTTTT
jgi:hypothetical protein